jgi:Protein of unknown function (DUF3105)
LANTSGTGGGSRRPTKAERKEEARHERDRIERERAARARNRNIGLVLIALAAVAVVVVVVVVQAGKSDVAVGSPKALLAQAAAATKSAGCDAVATTPNYDNAPGTDPNIDHVHIGTAPVLAPPPLSTYPTNPPASGPHEPTPLPAGVYNRPPDIYASIHSLEHAGAVIWYAPSAANSEAVKQIRTFYSQKTNVGQSKVIVAPFDYSSQGASGSLPSGVQMAMTAWHHLQTCTTPSLAVAYDFTSQYSDATPGGHYKGEAREPSLPL